MVLHPGQRITLFMLWFLAFTEAITMKSDVTGFKTALIRVTSSITSLPADAVLFFSVTILGKINFFFFGFPVCMVGPPYLKLCSFVFHLTHFIPAIPSNTLEQRREKYKSVVQYLFFRKCFISVLVWAVIFWRQHLHHSSDSCPLPPDGCWFFDSWAVSLRDEVKGHGLKPTRIFEKPDSFLTPPTCQTQPANPLKKRRN